VDIKNQLISFSKTEVSNSALNLDVFGTHSFNNEIDYHIKLLLGEFLAKRPGKNLHVVLIFIIILKRPRI
jgi:hypothetical protein